MSDASGSAVRNWVTVEKVWKDNYPRLIQFAHKRGANLEDAEDLAQDLFAKLVQKCPEGFWAGCLSPWDWLKTALVHGLISRQRRRTMAPLRPKQTNKLIAPENPLPENNEKEIQRSQLLLVLEKIRPLFLVKTWLAFWNTGMEKKPAKKVAQELGMSVAAVRQAKSRVVKKIREKLYFCRHVLPPGAPL